MWTSAWRIVRRTMQLRFYLRQSQNSDLQVNSQAGTLHCEQQTGGTASYQASNTTQKANTLTSHFGCISRRVQNDVCQLALREKAKSSFSVHGDQAACRVTRHEKHSVANHSLDKLEVSGHDKDVANLQHIISMHGSSFGSSLSSLPCGVRACRQ